MRRCDRERDTQTPSKRGGAVHQAADRCSLPGGAREALRLALRGSSDVTIGTTAGTITTLHWLTGAGGRSLETPDGSIRRHDALHRALHELLPDLPRHGDEPLPRDRRQARRAQAFPPDDGV